MKKTIKRPIIGLIPLYDDEKDSFWMLPGYMKVLERCGALPIMLPYTTDQEELQKAYDLCDGILLTGGHDVGTYVYGEESTPQCGTPCRTRDVMEGVLLDLAIQDDKPVFGICRGIQFMNAHLGGTLYQDLPTERASAVEHHMSAPYDRPIHQVTVLPDTHLASIIGAGEHAVNSYHHQAVKELSEKVTVMARSEDGLVEAIEVKDSRFIMGVQWHPEFSYETSIDSIRIMQAFTDACVRYSSLLCEGLHLMIKDNQAVPSKRSSE